VAFRCFVWSSQFEAVSHQDEHDCEAADDDCRRAAHARRRCQQSANSLAVTRASILMRALAQSVGMHAPAETITHRDAARHRSVLLG
jgi:hypothetical protein